MGEDARGLVGRLSHDELIRRLEEAEETIRAIREGEIDALVIRPARDEEVFTLQGGADSYRAFMETMGHGAAALGAHGEVLYANSILCTLIGKPLKLLQGCVLTEQFEPAVGAQIAALFDAASAAGDGAGAREITITSGDETRHYLASAEPLQTGVVYGWAVTFTDLTDRVRAEQSVAAERAARAIIASANEAVVVCDAEGKITHANAAVAAIQDGDILGKPFHQAFDLRFPGAGSQKTEDIVRMAVSGTATKGIEAHAPQAPQAKDLLFSAAPLSPADGAIGGCVITMFDLSQRKAAEKQQTLLMGELDHRVKNTLTLVLSILGRTTEMDIESFRETFSGRIHALAATHNLLSANAWSTLSVGEVVAAELAPYVQSLSERCVQSGPELALSSRAAIAIGLVFHELASNAAKYGALSNGTGQIAIAVSPFSGGNPAEIEWRESGGPAVEEPRRTGFGKTVITRSLAYARGGGADLHFDRSGVRCVMRIPAEDVVA